MIEFNTYKNGAHNIVTFSFDDGQIHDRRLVELLDKYGCHCTFNLNSGVLGQGWTVSHEEIPELYKNHEVAVHSKDHPWLEKMTPACAIMQIMEDRKTLEKDTGYVVRGMAYPFGTYDDQLISALKACGIVYSRTVGEEGFNLPRDFMKWSPTCHWTAAPKYVDKFLSGYKSEWCSYLFYIWGHSFELPNGNGWEEFEQTLKKISGLDNVWYATNIEIYDYVTAQHSLQISVDESIVRNPTQIDVWINKDKQTVKIPAGETVRF